MLQIVTQVSNIVHCYFCARHKSVVAPQEHSPVAMRHSAYKYIFCLKVKNNLVYSCKVKLVVTWLIKPFCKKEQKLRGGVLFSKL